MNKFTLGSWTVEPSKSLLTSENGKEVRIEPLNMALLCYFAKNPVDPINREKLIEDVWDNKIVTDHAVYKTINQLRKYLASDGDTQDYIKTIPKKGYSLVATLEEIIEASPKEAVSLRIEASSENRFKKWFYRHPVINTLSILLAIGLLIWNLGINAWWYKVQQPLYSDISVINQIEGILDEAVPSPDEKWLAVTSYDKSDIENRSIKVLNLETQKQYQLTKGKYDYSEIAWSTSGKNLVASRRPDSSMSTRFCDLVILELSQDYSKIISEKEVTSCSPRGSSAQYDEESGIVYYNFSKSSVVPSSVYSYSLESGDIEILTQPERAVWGDWSVRLSPDKRKLLYMRVYEEDNEIFIYDLDSKEEKLIFKYIGYIDQLSWANNGNAIIYQPNKNQVAIYSLAHDFHKILVTKDDSILGSYHSTISDSIYTVSRLNDIEIVELPLSNPKDAEVINPSKAMDFSGIFANTSDNYAYVSKKSGKWQLWLQSGNQLKMLTNNKTDAVIYTPSWSFDDERIVFNMSGKVYVYDIKTNKTTEVLSQKDVYLQNPFWSSDAKSIYFTKFVKGTNQIFNLDLTTEKIKQITSNGGYSGAVTQDDTAMFLVKDDHQGLWRLDLLNLEEVKVNEIANTDDFEFIHSVDDGVYFSHVEGLLKSLYFVDYKTLSTTKLVEFVSKDFAGFSVNYKQDKALTTITRASDASLTIYRP